MWTAAASHVSSQLWFTRSTLNVSSWSHSTLSHITRWHRRRVGREKKVKIKFMNESQKKKYLNTSAARSFFYSQLVRYFNIKKRECASAITFFFFLHFFSSFSSSRHKIAARDCIRKCAAPEKLHFTCCHRRCLTCMACTHQQLTNNVTLVILLTSFPFFFILHTQVSSLFFTLPQKNLALITPTAQVHF